MKTNRTLEIKILSEQGAQQAASERFTNAWRSGEYAGEYLTFTSPGSFFEVINARRWDLVVALHKSGRTSIRALAN